MQTLFRSFLVLGLLGGMALLAQPSPAQAAVTIKLSGWGFATETVNSDSYDGNFGGLLWNKFHVKVDVSTASSPTEALLQATAVSVRSLLPLLGGATITVTVTQTFTEPISAPLTLSSHLEVTELSRGGKVTYQSFLNETPTDKRAISRSPILGLWTDSGDPDPVDVHGVSPGATYYTLTSITTISLYAWGKARTEGTTAAKASEAPTAVPEPETMAMAILAAPLLVIGYRRHRRRADSQA